ncbi:beta-1,4-N-acetylgalactosaminyltransferase bre-4-like, partial [Paramuricea clavata]
MTMFILSGRTLAKSFVAMTFLLMGAMLLYFAQEDVENLNHLQYFVLDSNLKENPFAGTGNVIRTNTNKHSQTTSAESQAQRQNSSVPLGHGKSMVLNSGNIRRLNGSNASAAKNNTQIQYGVNGKNSTAAGISVKYAKPLDSQTNIKHSQTTSAESQAQRQNSSVPLGHGKSMVLNSENTRRLNGPNSSAAKNNTQIQNGVNVKNSTAAGISVKYAKPLDSQTNIKHSQTTSAESQAQRQNSSVPLGYGKSMVLNSENTRRLNGPNVSAAKNNTQIQHGVNVKNSTAADIGVKNAKPLDSQNNSQQSNSHMIQPTNRQNVSQAQTKPTELPLCKKPYEELVRCLQVNQSVPNMEDIASSWDEVNWVFNGGAWRPVTCQAASKVAIIIAYRDRYAQLKIFLRHMHPILKRQLLDYRIIVVEQNSDALFNKGMLFNIGYKEALRLHDFQCFVFHDVDLLLEDDRNYYGCALNPRHLSVAVDKFGYRLPYFTICGGVVSFTKEQFEKINGYSNIYWGWGGEDDDLYQRACELNKSHIIIEYIIDYFVYFLFCDIISTDEDPGLRIESFAVINLRGVSLLYSIVEIVV